MDYRKFYKEEIGMDLTGFDIHHIDFDRSNNDVDNLVALPTSLHRRYHYYHSIVSCERFALDPTMTGTDPQYGVSLRELDILNKWKDFIQKKMDVDSWIGYKMSLITRCGNGQQ